MTTQQEQDEAKQIQETKANFPKIKWLGVWSRKEKKLRLVLISWVRGLGPGWGAPDNYNAAISIGIEWKLPDLWIGIFWKGDRDERFVWICLIPCLPIRFHYRRCYGGWIMSPSKEPSIPRKHQRRWWQIIKAV